MGEGTQRKWPEIDVVKLYVNVDHQTWNRYLSHLLKTENIEEIKKTLYGIQSGMAKASSKKMTDKKMTLWFVRVQKSLHDTAKMIFRKKYPHPLDNPENAKNSEHLGFIDIKRKRDGEFQKFLKDVSF